MFIKPARPEVHVRDPRTKQHLPAEGLEVPESSPWLSYWIRRLNDGDVVLSAPPVVQVDQIHDSAEEQA